MTSINIIGTGNVAWHMAQAIYAAESYTLQGVAGRSKKSLKDFKSLARETSRINELIPSDITMIVVSDDVIKKVAKEIPYTSGLFIHTSGSVSINVLESYVNHGVFYPLQSFSKEVALNFKEVPICIEASSKSNVGVLEELGFALSEKVTTISSAQRKKLHLAAVFVNNFSNHCFTIAQELCNQQEVPFDLLRPLLHTTANKALFTKPNEVQTGPAKRGDKITIASHINELSNPMQREVYKILSEAITQYYGKKL